MKRLSFVLLCSSAVALLNGQTQSQIDPLDSRAAIVLSHAINQDLYAGKIGSAQIHVIQTEMVLLAQARSSAAATGADPTPQSGAQMDDLRARFLKVGKAKPFMTLPDDSAATAPLLRLAAGLELATETGDLEAARDVCARLRGAVAKLGMSQSEKHLAEDVQKLPEPERTYVTLSRQLREALREGDLAAAEVIAPEVIQRINSGILQAKFLGNDLYNAYDALGRSAFRRGDYDAAIRFLLNAAQTRGSPNLDTFGPNLTLAKWLLDKGYAKEVIEFLTNCKVFWKSPHVDRWIAEIKAGEKPTFLPNVHYPS